MNLKGTHSYTKPYYFLAICIWIVFGLLSCEVGDTPITDQCITEHLSTKPIPEFLASIKSPDAWDNLSFVNQNGYQTTYKKVINRFDSFPLSPCTPSIFGRRIEVEYKTDQIGHAISYQILIPFSKNSTDTASKLILQIGDMRAHILIDSTIIYTSNTQQLHLKDFIVLFGIRFDNVYHITTVIKEPNDINGIVLHPEKGILAFYVDLQHYWIRI